MEIEKIKNQLIRLAQEDQYERTGRYVTDSDKTRTEKLKLIIESIGWPSIKNVGEKASNAAWLIAQHSDYDINFQEECLSLMKKLEDGDILKKNIAYLEDRVRVNKGEPQVYGTQFYKDDEGKFIPRPILDEENIEKRWSQMDMGWPSFKEYKEMMNS